MVNGLHVCASGHGRPVVVLEAGIAASSVSWSLVQPRVAEFTRVLSYDRAGFGWSAEGSGTGTAREAAGDLNRMLEQSGETGPYVLVGHSMGGYDVRLYASLYRDQVAGMVLVDSSHPDQENRFPPELRGMEAGWLREAEFVQYSMPFGIPRLLGLCDEDAAARAAECNWHSAAEAEAELKNISVSAAQTAATGSLGDLPLEVLSHDPDKPSADLPADLAKPTNDAWENMQEELAHLSTRGTQMIAKNSSHYIQLDRPEVVVEAVQRVVAQARAAQTAGQAPSSSPSPSPSH